MNIIQLKPAYKDYLWGGNRLREQYGKEADLDCIAESWELSDHSAGQSIVMNGPFQGKTFGDYLKENGKEILGSRSECFENFPVLIKFIDAKLPLSIQVHPDDAYAMKNENSYGKTEMWYILDCEEGAFIYYGVNQPLTKEALKKHIENNTVTEVLNKVEVKKGDCFFIEAGTIHAIGAGIIICEIQQNSNLTYRVYDYDRRDAAGNARPLHIEQAMAVSKLTPNPCQEQEREEGKVDERQLASCSYFTSSYIKVNEQKALQLTTESFVSLIVLEGEGEIVQGGESLAYKKGESFFIPAQEGELTIKGSGEFIVTTV